MALINCPECGKEISDKAQSCINCGLPLKELKSGGMVKIKMPVNIAGILNVFGGFNDCIIKNAETEKELWSGKHGQVAEFYLSKATGIVVTFGNMSNPLECTINPAGNSNYTITLDRGIHWRTTYNISKVDVIDSE